jgi:hypothetical protein
MPLLLPMVALVALLGAGDQPAPATACVGAEEAVVHVAGDDGGPPKFTAAFLRRRLTLDVSLDGIDGKELPVSIEEVCDVPKRLRKQATQLAGGDGVALLLDKTVVSDGTSELTGDDATTALEGADTALVHGRLTRPASWHADEDGDPIPTFRTGRVDVTD